MIYCMGEALIDFVPVAGEGAPQFAMHAGGAPANVAAAVAKLGGQAAFIGKIGADPFGDFIAQTLAALGVDVSLLLRAQQAQTTLAFVTLDARGDRRFSFYRNPGAETLLSPQEVPETLPAAGDVLHFGSVCLTPSPAREAHRKALRTARRTGALITFDANLRPSLWPSEAAMREAVADFIDYADVVKLSEEEFPFVTGREKEEDAAQELLMRSAEAVVISRGGRGAAVYFRDGRMCSHPAYQVRVADTVGAGDAFWGALLSSLDGVAARDVAAQDWGMMLEFACAAAACSVSRPGGISSLPTFDEAMAMCARR